MRLLSPLIFFCCIGLAFGGNESVTVDTNTHVITQPIAGSPAGSPSFAAANGLALSAGPFAWADVTGTPTTLAGYGITDAQPHSANLDTWSVKTPFAGTFTITGGKTFAVSNTLTFTGTDGSTLNVGAGGTLEASAFTDTTNAGNISSGTMNASRLPAAAVQTTGTFTLTGSYDFSGATGSKFPIAGLSGPTAQGTINGASAFVTTVEEHGGKADGKSITDLGITASSTTITSASADFTSGDVGKGIAIQEGTHQSFSGATTSGSTTVTCDSTANIVAGMWVSQNINAVTTANFTAGSNTITVASATGIQVGMTVTAACINGRVTPVTVSAISGTTVTLSPSTNAVLYTETDQAVNFNQNILPSGAYVASVTDSTHFVVSSAPTYGATGTLDFLPQTIPTTITGVTSATTATVAVSNLITSSDCRATFGTDNTSAFQSAFNAIGAAGGGTLQLKTGIYYIGGPIQEPTGGGSTGQRNAVILIPNYSSGSGMVITMQGAGDVSRNQTGFINYEQANTGGTIIYCPTVGSGTHPCIFGGNNSATVGTITLPQVTFKHIEFRLPLQPTLGVVNLLNGGLFCMSDFLIDADGYFSIPNNSHTGPPMSVVAILMPGNNSAFNNVLKDGSISGQGTAIEGGTLSYIERCDLVENTCAFQWEPTYGGLFSIDNCNIDGDPYVFYGRANGYCWLRVNGGYLEQDSTGPLAVQYEYYSPSNGIITGLVDTYRNLGYPIRSNEGGSSVDDIGIVASGLKLGVGTDGAYQYNPAAVMTGFSGSGQSQPFDIIADSADPAQAHAVMRFSLPILGSGTIGYIDGTANLLDIYPNSGTGAVALGNFAHPDLLQINPSNQDNDVWQNAGNFRVVPVGYGFMMTGTIPGTTNQLLGQATTASQIDYLPDRSGVITLDGLVTSNSTGTATFNSTSSDEIIYNSSSTTVAALTITLPTTSRASQIVKYATNAAVTAITMAGGTVDIGVSPTSATAGNVFVWQSDASGHWIREQ